MVHKVIIIKDGQISEDYENETRLPAKSREDQKMEKVLRKRAWRDLKENKFRYFALAFLIIISMYLVISLVCAADTIVDGTTKQA